MSFDLDVEMQRGEMRVALKLLSPGGITVLFGPSGVGKTSILAMVAGLLTPDRGQIRVCGRTLFDGVTNLPPEARRAGYVFQDGRLFPHMRVEANLRYGMAREAQSGDWTALIDLLGIEDLLRRWPRSLSGGEAKRVAIGRALLSGADFLLLDEPLASLDAARAEEIMDLVETIRDERSTPMLYVTHDRAEAERLATKIVEMRRE
ncbi:ATP-binding cassette domain-containing protein [Pacificimonas sp. WHA3]|uniref:ATP-binding cassette domain-containing protein n=1 Tax=Pacificimonas pallii TaxID=2827236 RepID=A0ABS6SAI7_9SPHN|nr:ATP-binding cassette domain-containing protein [Pacificimonas pallii]MBV7255399.1 ATP-binding cassette domain-containing protein [Pacificimonas pallii]